LIAATRPGAIVLVGVLRRAQALTGSVKVGVASGSQIAGLFRFFWRHAGLTRVAESDCRNRARPAAWINPATFLSLAEDPPGPDAVSLDRAEGIMTIARGVITVALVLSGAAGCRGMAAPSRVADASDTHGFAVFLDRETGFRTSDVRDAQDQIVRFNDAGELVWIATGARFPGYLADGQVVTAERICAGCYFFVRFGSRGGEPRAYLTWAGSKPDGQPPTVLDVEVVGVELAVSSTDIEIPKN
jgi:hypothetical protein